MKSSPVPGNRLHPDDPRLASFALGELSEKDAAFVRDACAADPALAAALEELQGVERHLSRAFSVPPLTLEEGRLAALQAAAAASGPKPFPVRGVLIGTALLVLAMVIYAFNSGKRTIPPPPAKTITHHAGYARPVLVKPATLRLPAPGPAVSSVAPKESDSDSLYPRLGSRGFTTPAETPDFPLPVKAGNQSMAWVRQSILAEEKLPPRDAVRAEELLNAIALTPAGAAVLRGAVLSAETLPCPWKPSSTLVFVSFRGKRDADCEVTASFSPSPAAVGKYRLSGWLPVSGQKEPMDQTLAKGTATRLMLEIETTGTSDHLGEIRWNIDGRDAPPLALSRQADAEPSDDARFASLVCMFSEWLSGDARDWIDAELLAALARELAAPGIPKDREEFLQLIDRAIRL